MRPLLPSGCYEVARMCAAGMPARDIAEHRGTSLNTVHSQLRKARLKLRAAGHHNVGNAITLGLALDAIYGPDTAYHGPYIDLETA